LSPDFHTYKIFVTNKEPSLELSAGYLI